MNEELQTVYRERVLDHSRNPHNFGRPPQSDREAVGFNPLCGDKLTVYLKLTGDRVDGVNFEGTGCAISIASASMMTDALTGLSLQDAEALIETAGRMLTDNPPAESAELDEFRALEGVRAYPSRIKCATLAWSAAQAALNAGTSTTETVSTE